ncbi:helix-turn-helix domain-containing protein [Gordonia malaquae]|uniref:helix-turn-helix domain-containing protein n=1 Tax=Gordonia malaquae TaxID=410332 RepID=UPI0030190980
MPSVSPAIPDHAQNTLRAVGAAIRARRKVLGLAAAITAESAGMSRVTLSRIESGKPSVTIGAYAAAADALGLQVSLAEAVPAADSDELRTASTEGRVRVDRFLQLRALAWQLRGDTELTMTEALALYERSWRHVDVEAMSAEEKAFVEQLVDEHGGGRLLV